MMVNSYRRNLILKSAGEKELQYTSKHIFS